MSGDLVKFPLQIAFDPSAFRGKDNFELWKEIPGNEEKTILEFFDAMKGPKGDKGDAGSGGGGDVVLFIDREELEPGQTTNSTSYVATGLQISRAPAVDSRIRLQVSGVASHTQAGNILHFTLFRKIGAGSFTDITPAGRSGLATVRNISSDYVEEFDIDHFDNPATTELVTYALYWKVHNNTGHLGKRPSDTIMNVATGITLSELEPLGE